MRELCNVLEYARSMCAHGVVMVEDLPEHMGCAAAPDTPADTPADRPLPAARVPATRPAPAAPDRASLLELLRQQDWNVSEAARKLGVARMTLYRWMRRHAIHSPNRSDAARGAQSM